MKTRTQKAAFLSGCFLLGCILPVHAQIWKRVKERVKQTVEDHIVNKSGDAANKAMEKTEKSISKGVDKPGEAGDRNEVRVASDYKSYDFVPGDKIIFQPDLSNEPDAELPARFTLNEGNAEIQSYNGEKILHIDMGTHESVSPLMSSDHYLPEQFTAEFDMMYENPENYFRYANSFEIEFRAQGDNNSGNYPLYSFSLENGSGAIWGKHGTPMVHFPEAVYKSLIAADTWHHVAIYIHKNIGKVYIDQYRVAASNTMPAGAGHMAIKGDPHYGFKIKNMRIAAGGDDKYNKIVTDGKFITHGILFDVNQSVIRPESAGTLNEVAKLIKDHSDLKFEIDGYTDSDGPDDTNLKLSQARAEAVKAKLSSLGIDAGRLTAKGFGETNPIDKNDTAEGKANNRRVEFVKM